MRLWNQSDGTPIAARSRLELIHLFDRLELLEPGVVSCSLWRAEPGQLREPVAVYEFGGVGRKR